MDEQAPQTTVPVEPPRGMFAAKLDERGRLKLPAEFQRYFGNLPGKRYFVTSLDRRIASIYPIQVWKENEKFFDEYTDEPEIAENVRFNADDLGSEEDLDAQGRIQFSAQLRRALELEGQPVRLQASARGIRVLSDAVYQERLARSTKAPESDVKLLQRAGLK